MTPDPQTRIVLDPGGVGHTHQWPITVPINDVVLEMLSALEEEEGLDRDEAYLKRRLEDGEQLFVASFG